MQVLGDDDLSSTACVGADGGAAWTGMLCEAAQLPAAGAAVFEVDGRRIAVFVAEGTHHAIDDYCTHGQSSLSEDGELCGLIVHCGLHRAQFDVTTGQVQRGPTRQSLRSYEIVIEGALVRVTERPLVEKRRALRTGDQ